MTIRGNMLLSIIILSIWAFSSCGSNDPKQKDPQTERASIPKKPKLQEARDAHGCIISDGYVWSAAMDSCIRLWESGIELAATNHSELVVFLVESNDKTKAEIFVPGDSTLALQGNGNGIYNNDSLTLLSNGNNYVVRQNGKAIYQTAPVAPPEEPKPAKKRQQKR